MLGTILGVGPNNEVYIYDNILGYEVSFLLDEVKLLIGFGAVSDNKIIKSEAINVLLKKLRYRVQPNGVLSFINIPDGNKPICVSKLCRSLGAYSVTGAGELVFDDSVEFVHKLAFCDRDCRVLVNLSECSYNLKRSVHMAAYVSGNCTISDYDEYHSIFSTEYSFLSMTVCGAEFAVVNTLLEYYMPQIIKLGTSGISEWGIDYDLGKFSSNNERMVRFLRDVVPSYVLVPDVYKFMVGCFVNGKYNKTIEDAIMRYVFD